VKEIDLVPQFERLQAMTADDGETWDLSPNDRMAIRYALSVIKTSIEFARDYAEAWKDAHPLGVCARPTGCLVCRSRKLISQILGGDV
jgi:hypothetical protein